MRGSPAIGFDYRPSPTLVVATVVVALLACVAVWISGLPSWVRLATLPGICGWTGFTVARLLLPRLRAVSWQADGAARLFVHDRRRNLRSEVLGAVVGARVMGPLIALRLRWPPREGTTIWLLPDNLDADTRRRLRMRLAADAGGLVSGNADSN